MIPADLRNLTWSQVQTHVSDDMRRVHRAWAQHGPGTTREVAERSGISLLTLRPRTCDLHKVGLVALLNKKGSEGVYGYRSDGDAQSWHTTMAGEHRGPPTSPVERRPDRMSVSMAARIMAQHRRKHRPTDSGQLSIFVA